jgi:hypothetical protein
MDPNYDFARNSSSWARLISKLGGFTSTKPAQKRALRDLKRGRKIEIDEKDVTQGWIATYEQIIAKYRELIAAYKATQSLKQPPKLRV